MAQGTIKRVTDKGFGFIEDGTGKDLFFHMSAVEGVRFEDLQQGQQVTFNEGQGPKGPRAENVRAWPRRAIPLLQSRRESVGVSRASNDILAAQHLCAGCRIGHLRHQICARR